ncbi:PKD domain-containing protein [Portibacter lacus]|uniref:PKD domain-containing protein n=1 Tax=Portibacter lacus TaxID=1099794 RepID=A0AA37SMG1_9BACT|nr:PKD domain-containing protein [Portibacter lacus]GLR15486.1 hypothetical protein GCM10007940_01010 [Portibacter lacus]
MILNDLKGVLLLMLFCCAGNFLSAQITVDFEADVNEGCSGIQVNFQDKSISSDGKIVSWKWDLVDGSSHLQNPGKIFASIGSFDICLTVEDDNGNSASLCKEKFVTVYEIPKADFKIDVTSGCAPLLVNYTDLSSSPNGIIKNWSWGLNGSNGIIKTSDSAREIFSNYNTPDIYSISLSVTDEKGCSNTITKPNLIEVLALPEIKVTTLDPIGCSFPMTVDFVNFGDEENIEYTWDFGNGEEYVGYDPSEVVYSEEGAYDVRIIAKNTLTLCSDTLILKDYINSGGTILFDFYPKEICRNGIVQFEDLSPVEADKWEWDFGDGTKSAERDPSHTYKYPGKYTISLSRKTAECSGLQVSQYQVEVFENPEFNFEIDKSKSCLLPAEVTFKTDYNDGSLYRWYIGKPGAYEAILSDQESSYAFPEYGSYEVRLMVDSKLGCRTLKLIDTVDIEPFKIEITGQTEGCIPFSADLGISSNSTVPLSNISWEILKSKSVSGPDSLVSNKENISIMMDEVSRYGLSLVVENSVGCIDSIHSSEILRGGTMPSVEFGISDDVVCPREVISFENLSSNNVDTWNWEINDSLLSEIPNPDMSFSSPGYYTVRLNVGQNGCYNSITKPNLFFVNYPGAAFDLEYNCEDPYRIKAINRSSHYDSIVWSYQLGGETITKPLEDSLEIVFPDKDIYILSLEAFNDETGCKNIKSDTVWISDLKSDFSVSTHEGCAPLNLEFTDQSVDAVSWKYISSVSTFSDDTLPNPTMRIYPAGEFDDIGLIVTDRHGCQDTSFTSQVRVNKVNASFPIPDPICLNDTLFLENTSTSVLSSITSVQWILGDGIDTSYLENGAFASGEKGKHDIKLVAEDEWGCKDSITTGLAAYFRAPNFELVADSLSCTTHEIDFRNILHSSSYKYRWSFGDGTYSKEPHPKHLYTKEGDFELAVRITDDESCVNDITLSQPVRVANPIASFAADSTFASCPPLATTFINRSMNSLNHKWNFGDESGNSGEFAPEHLYITPGIFDVELIAVRTEHCQDTILLSDLIQLEGPQGEFTFKIDSSCVPLKVSFEAALAEDYLLTWDYGDGNLAEVEGETDFSNVDYTYLEPGEFVPKIILEDKENCKITKEGEPIQTHALEAGFSVSDSIFCDVIPNSVQFKDETFSTNPITSYYWQIGSDTYDIQNPAYAVADTGRYVAQLVVKNGFCADTLTKENYINVGFSPILQPVKDTFNCINTEITLAALSADENDVFAWYNSIGEVVSNEYVSTIEDLNSSQFYVVEAKNEYTCSVQDTVYVEVINDETRFAGPDKTICFGSSLEMTIDYGSDILWSNLEDCRDCTTVNLSPDALSTYFLEITNEYGCLVKDTLVVDVLFQDDIDAGEDQEVCITEQPVLLAFVEGDVRWSPSNLVDSPNDFLTGANITESTLFYLESTKDECTLKDSVFINILHKANLEVVGDTVCYGEMSQLRAGGIIDNVHWEGDIEMISNTEIMNPTSNTMVSTRFMAIGDLGGCVSDTAYAEVMVYPEIVAQLPEVRQYFKGTEEIEVDLQIFSGGDYEYSWSPAEMVDCPSCPSVMIKEQDTAQVVSVSIMEPESGCSDTLSVNVRQFYGCQSAASGIGIPNIFSPNNDGNNDVLNIDSPAFDDIKSVTIFDRWGQQVFHTNTVIDSWDGTIDGSPVQTGVYTYLVQATCPDNGELVQTTGDVTVIR